MNPCFPFVKVPCVPVRAKQLCESFTIVTVASGARSLHSALHDETFHPVVGPMEEARSLHVGQSRLRQRAQQERGPLIVWDVGLGAAANAIALLEEWRGATERLELHSFDLTLEPLQFARAHADALEYVLPWSDAVDALV